VVVARKYIPLAGVGHLSRSQLYRSFRKEICSQAAAVQGFGVDKTHGYVSEENCKRVQIQWRASAMQKRKNCDRPNAQARYAYISVKKAPESYDPKAVPEIIKLAEQTQNSA